MKPRTIVDATTRDRTIQHLNDLTAYYTRTQLVDISGLTLNTIARLLDGEGVYTVLAGTSEKILAVPLGSETIEEQQEATRAHVTLLAQRMSQVEIARRCQASPETVRRALEEPWRLRPEVREKLRAIPLPAAPEKPVKPARARLHEVLSGRPWGEVRRVVARMARRGTPVPQIAAATGLPESRVRDALAGVSGARVISRSWPPAAAAQTRTTTRGRAA